MPHEVRNEMPISDTQGLRRFAAWRDAKVADTKQGLGEANRRVTGRVRQVSPKVERNERIASERQDMRSLVVLHGPKAAFVE